MDWRFFAGGIAMIIAGSVVSIVYGNILVTGPLEEFNPSRGIVQIGGTIGGIGFILTLISFGLRRKKRRPDEDATSQNHDKSG